MAEEEVGSLGQETLKLLRVLATESGAGVHATASQASPEADGVDVDPAAASTDEGTAHVCTTGWCPVCRLVGFVKENPDVVDEVAASALHLARTLRDALDLAVRQSGPRGGGPA